MHEQDQYSQKQYRIALSIHCPKSRCEVLLDDLTTAEFLVEELFAQVLTTFFETVLIDDVTLTLGTEHEAPITIILRAQGFEVLRNTQNLDIVIEDHLTCALTEIFDSLHVERCAVL